MSLVLEMPQPKLGSVSDWDAFYEGEEYTYGVEPNDYFKTQLEGLKPGKILLPCDGEGRNGVFAAVKGWEVVAFDHSRQGKDKAEALARSRGVTIQFDVSDIGTVEYKENEFDAIALIHVHFEEKECERFYKRLLPFLKKDGVAIVQVFSENHLKYREMYPDVGGPYLKEYLFTREKLMNIFKDFEVLCFEEIVVDLKEGTGHVGKAAMINFLAKKN